MKVSLLTSWYDEPAEWLYQLVASAAPIIDRVIAVDGAYALYPNAKGRSPEGQAAAVAQASREAGLGLTLYEPAGPWAGNEIEKRQQMFRLAAIDDVDWLLILDADERVLSVPGDWERVLAMRAVLAFDVEQVIMPDRRRARTRKLFRPPLRVGSFHAEYLSAGGDVLTGDAPFSGLVVEHRKVERRPDRVQAAAMYYERREDAGIEVRK